MCVLFGNNERKVVRNTVAKAPKPKERRKKKKNEEDEEHASGDEEEEDGEADLTDDQKTELERKAAELKKGKSGK